MRAGTAKRKAAKSIATTIRTVLRRMAMAARSGSIADLLVVLRGKRNHTTARRRAPIFQEKSLVRPPEGGRYTSSLTALAKILVCWAMSAGVVAGQIIAMLLNVDSRTPRFRA